MSEKDMVKRTVTLLIPKRFDEFLEGFAKLIDIPVEGILKDELTNVLSQFYSGGFYQRWLEKHGKDHVQELEQEVMKLYDC